MTAAIAVVNYQSLAVAPLATGQFGVPDLSDDEGILLLRYVDEYSDMVFNQAMLRDLLIDIRVWREREPTDSRWCTPAQFEELIALVEAAQKNHWYVVFLGS